jgi:hypothetical protein
VSVGGHPILPYEQNRYEWTIIGASRISNSRPSFETRRWGFDMTKTAFAALMAAASISVPAIAEPPRKDVFPSSMGPTYPHVLWAGETKVPTGVGA